MKDNEPIIIKGDPWSDNFLNSYSFLKSQPHYNKLLAKYETEEKLSQALWSTYIYWDPTSFYYTRHTFDERIMLINANYDIEYNGNEKALIEFYEKNIIVDDNLIFYNYMKYKYENNLKSSKKANTIRVATDELAALNETRKTVNNIIFNLISKEDIDNSQGVIISQRKELKKSKTQKLNAITEKVFYPRMISGSPFADDFSSVNPFIKIYREYEDLEIANGKEKASLIMWAFYILTDKTSFYSSHSYEETIEIINSFIPDFNENDYPDVSFLFSFTLNLSEDELQYRTLKAKYEDHVKFNNSMNVKAASDELRALQRVKNISSESEFTLLIITGDQQPGLLARTLK